MRCQVGFLMIQVSVFDINVLQFDANFVDNFKKSSSLCSFMLLEYKFGTFVRLKVQTNQKQKSQVCRIFLIKKLQCFTSETLRNDTSESEKERIEILNVIVQSL